MCNEVYQKSFDKILARSESKKRLTEPDCAVPAAGLVPANTRAPATQGLWLSSVQRYRP